jgi:hypothetical protein
VPVEHGHRLGLAYHVSLLVGRDRAVLHLRDVLRYADHAMGVVPGQVGVDQTRRDLPGLVCRRAGGGKNRRRELTESVRCDLHCMLSLASSGW